MKIEIKHCSVLDVDADIIVNAANNHLAAGGGLCGAIFNKAGYELLSEACTQYDYVETGDVAVTKGFGTKAEYIIHAVGPCIDTHPDYATLLKKLYHNILTTADRLLASSVAIPCISTGIFGCPLDECTDIALRVAKSYHSHNIQNCILCCYTQEEYDTYVQIHKMQSSRASHNPNDIINDTHTLNLQIPENIHIWKMSPDYQERIEYFLHIFDEYNNPPYIILYANSIEIPILDSNNKYTHIKLSAGYPSSFRNTLAVTNSDQFAFSVDRSSLYGKVYIITKDTKADHIKVYTSIIDYLPYSQDSIYTTIKKQPYIDIP